MPEPSTWGLKYEEVVGLTWLAYKGQGTVGRWRFPNAGSVWNLTAVYQVLNFRAVLVEGPKRILSFSGTDQLTDWGDNIQQGLLGLSPQYLGALAVALQARPEIVVGHSLGGGLASYVAIYQGRRAATVNPAPLNINLASGLPMIINNGSVFNYVVRGEALDVLDTYTLGMRRIGRIHYVSSTGTDLVAKHLLPNLVGFNAPVRA
jgi:pimeloyl-ACP methyl ester carboxylesterase